MTENNITQDDKREQAYQHQRNKMGLRFFNHGTRILNQWRPLYDKAPHLNDAEQTHKASLENEMITLVQSQGAKLNRLNRKYGRN
jgi:hypothetical protein